MRMTFTKKLALGMLALSLAGLFVVYIFVNTVVYDLIHENIIHIAYSEQATHASEIDSFFGTIRQTVINLGTVLSALRDDYDFQAILTRFVEEYDFVDNIFIAYMSGDSINGQMWEPHDEWDVFERPWFGAAMEVGVGNTAVTDIFWSQSGNVVVMAISTFLPDVGDDGAVLIFSVTLGFLEYVSNFPIIGGGYLSIVADNEMIILHPNTEYSLNADMTSTFLSEIPNGELILNILSGNYETTTIQDHMHGESYIVYAHLDEVGWMVYSVIPAAGTGARVNRILIVVIGLIASVFCFLLVTNTSFVSWITKNMEDKRVADLRIMKETMQERQRVEVAEENSKAKSQFLASMSHEIRTPLNAILGISEILLKEQIHDAKTRDALGKLYTSGDMLLGIINDILDLSKIEAGKMEIVTEPLDLASLISDTALLNTMRKGNKNIEFILSVDENLPANVLGDELRIKQILNNILSNAFKYTQEGVIKMAVSFEQNEDNQITLIFHVSDTGQGMSKEQMDKLFDEYARFNHETNRFIEGTGLGMSIVQKLAALMDAEISVTSELNEGTTFIVSIPLSKTTTTETIGMETADNLQRFRATKRLQKESTQFTIEPMPYGSVLIVDDVEINIYVAQGLLAPYELKIDSASDGLEAMKKVENGNEYDIIFMDHMMPVLDGVETTKRLRAMGYTRPIVALTANVIAGQTEIFFQNGFDDCISKPIDMRQMNHVLNKHVRDKAQFK